MILDFKTIKFYGTNVAGIQEVDIALLWEVLT
jgi:hypothetical protein